MRKLIDMQAKIFVPPITRIEFDLNSRDEIPKVLMGLQAVFSNRKTREGVFDVLRKVAPKSFDLRIGRPGMDLWKVLVLGMLRLTCNVDYDKLHELANEHRTLRMMLGHGDADWSQKYPLQTIKDNVRLLTPEILDKINRIICRFGHGMAGKKADEPLKGSCDSFVVETNVHFPTDLGLLFDAVRKTLLAVGALAGRLDLKGWRKNRHNIRLIKRKSRKAAKLKRSTAKDETKKARRDELIKQAHRDYIDLAGDLVDRAQKTLNGVDAGGDMMLKAKMFQIQGYIDHANRQIDQIRRRVIEGESIPHHEKIFSIFEEHTEWISKGKAGVPVELGLRVSVVRDQYGFILHHRVMEGETDDKAAVPIVRETKERFEEFNCCTFDKGYHSKANQLELAEILDMVVLPRKGRLSAEAKEIESAESFRRARMKHSAVESSINALENHGLDRCLDHGVTGFKRYAALAVVARNLHILGHMVQQKEMKRRRRLEKKRLTKLPLAA